MKNLFATFALCSAAVLFLTVGACTKSDSEEDGHGGHWSYSGDTGPDHWADLDPQYEKCANTDSSTQSPIDFSGGFVAGTSDITYGYKETGGTVVNNGHTYKFTPTDGGGVTIGGKYFRLLQFHFHTPSEHTVNGGAYPMEGHLVNQADDGTIAVVGVFFENGRANDVVSAVWAAVGGVEEEKELEGAVNPTGLLPTSGLSYWRYAGSLTTPDCQEGLIWTVLKANSTADPANIANMQSAFGGNARPVQPLNGREITEVN